MVEEEQVFTLASCDPVLIVKVTESGEVFYKERSIETLSKVELVAAFKETMMALQGMSTPKQIVYGLDNFFPFWTLGKFP